MAMEFAEELWSWLLLIISYYMEVKEKEFGSCQGSFCGGHFADIQKWTQTIEEESAPEGVNYDTSCNSCD